MKRQLMVVSVFLGVAGFSPAFGDTEDTPGHSHDASPVTTHGTGPPGQHQHRTGHDPGQGLFSHVGNGNFYRAYATWVNATFHSNLKTVPDGAGGRKYELDPNHTAFAHGHQHAPGRYALHRDDQDNPFPMAVADDASTRLWEAVQAWQKAANVEGSANWPGANTDLAHDGADPNEVPRGGRGGVPWDSQINWIFTADTNAHQVHVTYQDTTGDAGNAGALAVYDPTLQTIQVRTDEPFYYGASTNPNVFPHFYDFGSVILHEFGHVVGLLHFGEQGTHIMTEDGQPFRDGHLPTTHGHSGGTPHVPGDGHPIPPPAADDLIAGTLRTIDADAIHGVRDLYAISVLTPEPATLSLLALSGLLLGRRRRR